MDSHYSIVFLHVVLWLMSKGACQFSDNTPPSMWLERNWRIPETEPVGNVIVRVNGRDNDEGDRLVYGLEAKTIDDRHLPFRIDNNTGVVYLNESLNGRGGQNMFLYVTVSDGHVEAKSEVWVNILPTSTKNNEKQMQPKQQGGIKPPSFLPYPQFPHHPSGRQPIFQQKTYPDAITSSTSVITSSSDITSSPPISEITNKDKTIEQLNDTLLNDIVNHQSTPVQSVPQLAVTLVPILSVCAIFVAVAVIAFVFRRKLAVVRRSGGKKKKKEKEDMRKDSNGIALAVTATMQQQQEELAMQQWRGPRAFSNRYEPWERDMSQLQVGNQLSSTTTTTPIDRWEYPRHRLKFFNILGEGAFGQVWKCEATNINGNEGVSVVAVKTLKENASEKERSDLVSELQVMKMLDVHPNVVRLVGCCTEKDPLFVVMEFVTNGKLQSYLRNSRAERHHYNNMHGVSKSLTSRDLTSFVYQVAKGMEFLAANGIIHRDLAARNVLINDDHVCKVADFGFARDVIESHHVYERKSEGRLPIRWMAPESLYDNIFSTKSDVWSFGVLMWEVVTLGSTPYPGLSAAEVMKKVRDGYRLDKPEHCRRELYNIMYYCWDKDAKQRPSFGECIELLEKLLMTETDYIELERFPDHSYYNMLNISDEKL